MPNETGDLVRHELKCWPRYFERLLDGTKTFEVRKDDRGFKTGDVLWLREWEPGGRGFTGRSLSKRVVFIYDDSDDLGMFHLREHAVVMGLGPMLSHVGHAHPAFVEAALSGSFPEGSE